jgi:hypothetical protein
MSALALCGTASAQQPFGRRGDDAHNVYSLEEFTPTPTPEMWFYLQERHRYDDATAAIRRNAEYKAAQRRLRLEARRWYGYSPSRPAANSTPSTGVFSPTWVGNSGDPYRWVGGGVLRVATRVETVTESTEESAGTR